MKKILGISLLAIVVSAPALASQVDEQRTTLSTNTLADQNGNTGLLNAATPVANNNIATTSYVQGAYKQVADKVDAILDDTEVETDGIYIKHGETVSSNLWHLDRAIESINDDFATKQGVVSTINNSDVASTGSGTVTVYNTWGADTTDTANVAVNVESTITAPGVSNNIYYGTGTGVAQATVEPETKTTSGTATTFGAGYNVEPSGN